MMTAAYFQMLARYNRWANGLLYDMAAILPEEAYVQDRGAFFGSLHGTMNHILVADRIWLARFTGRPNPDVGLDDILYADLKSLREARVWEDAYIIDLMNRVGDDQLSGILEYKSMAGQAGQIPLAKAFGHFFNHQTHHRGHCHCMLSQAGLKPPQFDLLYFNDDEDGKP